MKIRQKFQLAKIAILDVQAKKLQFVAKQTPLFNNPEGACQSNNAITQSNSLDPCSISTRVRYQLLLVASNFPQDIEAAM